MNGLVVVLRNVLYKQVRIIIPDIKRAATEDGYPFCFTKERQFRIQNCSAFRYIVIGAWFISDKVTCFLNVLADDDGALITVCGKFAIVMIPIFALNAGLIRLAT